MLRLVEGIDGSLISSPSMAEHEALVQERDEIPWGAAELMAERTRSARRA